MQLNQSELKLVAELLEMAGNVFSNHGCNDFSLEDTPENRQILIQSWMEDEVDSTREEAEEAACRLHQGNLLTTDTNLLYYFANKLKEQV